MKWNSASGLRSVSNSPRVWLLVSAIAVLLCGWCRPGHTAGTEYRLDEGDILKVVVQRHPEYSLDKVTVSAAGRLDIPGAGSVLARGKTVSQLERDTTTVMKKILLRPEVNVLLIEPRPKQVFVFGSVAKSGPIDLKPGWRVSEVLSLAGGLSVRPELAQGSLDRAGREPVALDLTRIFANANDPANFEVQAGDSLHFSARTIPIMVSGQVQKPGNYDVPMESGAADALNAAGGPGVKAALSKASIRRADGSVVPVDLFKITVLGVQDGNTILRPGDRLVVPPSLGRVTVSGAVQKPGYYELEDGQSIFVTQAVALAGGPTTMANLTKAAVKRADGAVRPINLYKVITEGDQASDFHVEPGDVVTIPEVHGITVLGAATKPGTFNLSDKDEPRLSDVLVEAGGIGIKPEDARITVIHNGAEGAANVVEVDPVALLDHNDATQDKVLQDGDVVRISEAKKQTVFIAGEINSPGAYQLRDGEGLDQLVLRAGGPKPLAMLSKVTVTHRAGKAETVDANPGGGVTGARPAVTLLDGDYVVIPKNTARVLVMAAVNQPGYYPLPENGKLTLGEVIMMAGGPRDRAKLQEVALIKQTPKGVVTQVLPMDKIGQGQVAAMNTPLSNGDIVYVPQGKQTQSAWGKIFQGLSVLPYLAFAGL